MPFNLLPPPNFRGLNSEVPIEIYTRRLPHWRQQGATYFVTFHFADALPKARLHELISLRRDWEAKNPPPRSSAAWAEFARQCFEKVENWMDAGHGACWLKRQEYATALHDAILRFHAQRYEIGCFTIMANHCHVVIRPYEGVDVESEVGAMKKVVTLFINEQEGLAGPLWQQESYDRIIRDEEHLYRVIQYIGANPRRAGVPRAGWWRWVNPLWEQLGWGFRDEA